MSVQGQTLIGRSEITPIRMLLAEDSPVVRHVLLNFLQDEPLLEVVGQASNFTELLEKAATLKPRIVLMDLHMKDEQNFDPEFVKSQLRSSAEHVLAMSLYNDEETVDLSNSYGASLLLDKSNLCTDLIPAVQKLCT
jgi:DNA-binding NarL/FixJ family response regulator